MIILDFWEFLRWENRMSPNPFYFRHVFSEAFEVSLTDRQGLFLLSSMLAASLINPCTTVEREEIVWSHWSKHQWHRRQQGNSRAWPRAQRSHRGPLMPSWHRHAPVPWSQTGFWEPSLLQSHAEKDGRRKRECQSPGLWLITSSRIKSPPLPWKTS